MAEVNYTGLAIGNGAGYAELSLKVSEQILPKLFAEVAYLKNYMVDGKYEMDAQNSATIIIPTLRRPTGRFKDMRDSAFNPYAPSRDRVSQGHIYLNIDKEYNEVIDIPEDMLVQNAIGGSIVSTMSEYVGKTVAENMNYITADAMIKASNLYNSSIAEADRKLARINLLADNSVTDAMAVLKAKIGNADLFMGDTSFNNVPLSQVISNTLEAKLLQNKNQFILESSYGQEILIEGTFGRITLGDNYAYRGRILGINTFVLPDGFFPSTLSSTLDFSEVPTAGKVFGIMGIAEATYRAFVDRGIKISDATEYRGWILQPLYRIGVTVAKPWGLGLLVSEDYASESLETGAFEGGRITETLDGAASMVYKTGVNRVALGTALEAGNDGWAVLTPNVTEVEGTVTVVGLDRAGKAVVVKVHTVA